MLFFTIFLILIISLGISVKKISEVTKTSEKVLIMLLYPCLFLAGILLGFDDKIVSNIDTIGWNMFFYLIGAMALCLAFLWLVRKVVVLLK